MNQFNPILSKIQKALDRSDALDKSDALDRSDALDQPNIEVELRYNSYHQPGDDNYF